ncbi:WD40/YVTN/BNR-like repeat-containing protein [Candidatus Halobonum tyrrellensis]|nr:hypothetical protein [Candidatus Halobonum tyrrellensis]
MVTAYAALGDGLVVVDTERETATRASALDGRALECLAVHPDAPDRPVVGTFESGLYRSTDAGETFERVDEFGADAVMSAAFAPGDPDELWAGTEPSRVYRSTDAGDSWAELDGLTDLDSADEWSFPPRPHTHHVRWLEPHPTDPERWYVAVEAGALVRTDDRGETWRDRVPDGRIDNHTLATHPDAPDRVWVAAGDGYAESDDAGETWRVLEEGLDRTYCWSVAVDAGDPDRVLVSAARSAREAHTAARAETYVYRKEGDGEWERLDDAGLPVGEGVTRPVLARGDAGEFLALSNRGLFRTDDAGDSWTAVDVQWPEGFESATARGLAVV